MTDLQILQLCGIIFTPLGLAWISNPTFKNATVSDIVRNRGVMLLSGMSAVTIGYLILTFRFGWDTPASKFVTIIGLVSLLKGLLILVVPTTRFDLTLTLERIRYFTFMPWIVLAFGIAALVMGYILS